MDIQRLRNLTTGRLHTEMVHVYEDIEFLTGEPGIMTHHIPAACRALQPFLKVRVPDEKFWEPHFDPEHQGEIAVEPLTAKEVAEFWKAWEADMRAFWEGKLGTKDQDHARK